jgi:hypothetical protein
MTPLPTIDVQREDGAIRQQGQPKTGGLFQMKSPHTIPDLTGGTYILAVRDNHRRTIPDLTGLPSSTREHFAAERVVARLSEPAFERVIRAAQSQLDVDGAVPSKAA